MPKKQKLTLEDLKVQSFMTTVKDADKYMLRGGKDDRESDCNCDDPPEPSYGVCCGGSKCIETRLV